MRFLLVGINAKYIHSNPAIYSLKAYAEREGFDGVETAEYTINNSFAYILEEIYKRKPEVIGLSCYIWNIDVVERLLIELPKILPETTIWLGGPEVSFRAEMILNTYKSIEGVMCGEGEKLFSFLLRNCNDPSFTYQNNLTDSTIPHIVMRSNATNTQEYVYIVPKDGYIAGNEIPFFHENVSCENRIIYYESQRGCPFRCAYCLSSIEKSLRFKDVSIVKKELKTFLDKRVLQVKFVDRTFNCDKKRTYEIIDFIRVNDNGITNFHFEVAADILTDEEILLIGQLRPGQVQLEIGVQTTNPKTLEAINRPCDMEKLRENVFKLRERGNVHIHLDLIAGLPYEDLASFRKSFNEVYMMKPHQLQLGFLKVLSGTEISKKVTEFGIGAGGRAPYEVMYTKWISYEEVNLLKRVEEMVEIYYNSAQFLNGIKILEKSFAEPFALYYLLSEYYNCMNYYVVMPKRFKRYDILLEFAEHINKNKLSDVCKINIEELRDALSLDYYLREKPKSKPDFVWKIPEINIDYSLKDPISGNFVVKED